MPGFYNIDRQIAPPAPSPSGGAYAIVLTTNSTGRTVGPRPYPVETSSADIPDWYPGGKTLPADTDELSASGPADTRVPRSCGPASRGRLAHYVIDRRPWTRVTGTTETDSDETYWAGGLLACSIERRHTETFDLATGKRTRTDETTTTLGIAGASFGRSTPR